MTTTELTSGCDKVVDACAPWSAIVRAAAGTPLMTIVADGVGNHDTMAGACSMESNTLRYGHHTVHQHACAEYFLAEELTPASALCRCSSILRC
jgi:uncharacterized protein YcgI (DUF1989 family)